MSALGQKRTCAAQLGMSAMCQKRTFQQTVFWLTDAVPAYTIFGKGDAELFLSGQRGAICFQRRRTPLASPAASRPPSYQH
jgi:hypothetical protein